MDAARQARTDLSIAVSRRDELAKQLKDGALLAASSGAAVTPTNRDTTPRDTLTQLEEAQAKLDELLRTFTERHPDVAVLREKIADLKARHERELAQLRQGKPGAPLPTGVTSNPVYQSTRLALNEASVEVAALSRTLAAHEAKVSDLRRLVNSMPEVEAEFARLNRDYDVQKSQYVALVDRLEKTRLGQDAEATNSGVLMKVLNPPTASVGSGGSESPDAHCTGFPGRNRSGRGARLCAVQDESSLQPQPRPGAGYRPAGTGLDQPDMARALQQRAATRILTVRCSGRGARVGIRLRHGTGTGDDLTTVPRRNPLDVSRAPAPHSPAFPPPARSRTAVPCPSSRCPTAASETYDQPLTVAKLAADIGPGLAKAALAGKVDGKLVDTSHVIDRDATVAIVTAKDPEGLEILRHSTAHLLAQAVQSIYPDAQVTIGPVIEDGFYYDFAFKRPFTPEDLEKFEAQDARARPLRTCRSSAGSCHETRR